MNQRFLGSIVAAALIVSTAVADDTLMQRFDKMEKEMAALKTELNTFKAEKETASKKTAIVAAPSEEKTVISNNEDVSKEIDDIKDQLSNLNKKTNGNNLKFGVDLRTSYDNLQYEMANGDKYKNDALFSNRLWLNMSYAATKNLSFTGQLAYNKIFGQRSLAAPADMDGFDWVSGESAYDDTLRVRSAYFFYQDDEFLGTDIPWTVSVGRRPSTEGHLINLRDDVGASSPLAHTVNVEFDGASAKFGMEELSGLDGSYFKLCAGRGMSEAESRFSPAPYSDGNPMAPEEATNNIDMIGIIVVPYDDKQYSTGFQYTYANNLIDLDQTMDHMETVGGLHTATAFAMVNGIGDGISEFLDDSTFFVSGAMSKTNPYKGAGKQGMLGGTDPFESKTGYSYWIGTQFPSLLTDDGRWGAEFNHGSQYWRPITYGEDTLIGSKIAARGDAYELYFTEPLVDDILTFQLRYTYIDYNDAGSNGFFGSTTGATNQPGMEAFTIDKAQDIRAYIRYRF